MKATQTGTQAGLDMNKSDKEKAREREEKMGKELKEKLPFCQQQFSSKKECVEKVPYYTGIKCDLCKRGGKV